MTLPFVAWMVYASTRIEATIVCVPRDRNQAQRKSAMFEALLDCLFSIEFKVGQKNDSQCFDKTTWSSWRFALGAASFWKVYIV